MENIKRHLTAIARKTLSRPMAWAKKSGIIGKGSILDYGCGRGFDTMQLQAEGFNIVGYDPFWAPEVEVAENYQVVCCNYVLNVIEDAHERIALIRKLWAMASETLMISVRTNRESIKNARPYKDGVITSKNTFQKLFTDAEIKTLFMEALGVEVDMPTVGVVVIRKDVNTQAAA
jgi:DNA phosphorothioation-associated putative methyltransferase